MQMYAYLHARPLPPPARSFSLPELIPGPVGWQPARQPASQPGRRKVGDWDWDWGWMGGWEEEEGGGGVDDSGETEYTT